MATSYQWVKRGTNGGGRTNDGCADTLNLGRMGLVGDVWGAHATDNFGDTWYSVQWGVTPHASAVSGDAYGRASIFSKRPATSGALYVGTGTLTGGAGHFGVVPRPGSFQQIIIDSANKFGTAYLSGIASNYPRPCGNGIIVDYDAANDIEYVITYNNFGVNVYKNGGGHNILAAQAPTQLCVSGTVTGPRWKTACMGYDVQHAFFGTYSFTTGNVASTSLAYLMSTSSSRIGTGTNLTTTVTDISTHIPGTGKLNWFENANSVVYAACNDGVYLVNATGTTWTSLGFPTNGGNPTCVRYSPTTGNLYVFCGTDPTGNHRIVAKGVGSGTTWTWTWLLTGSNWTGTEFGTGNTWWLGGAFAAMTAPAAGCLSGAVQNVDGTDFITAFGSGGINASRDGGATWQPCCVGAGGGECKGLLAGTGGSVTYQDLDYGTGQTTNHFVTASLGGTATAQLGLTVTKNGHTFSVSAAATPATASLDGADIGTDYFRGACISPAAVDISSETPPYLYVGMVGGSVLTGIPVTTPVAPTAGTPTLSTDTPIQGKVVSVLTNAASWGGNPPPTFAYQWQKATSALGTFSNIAGAFSSSYTPVGGDVGNVLRCQVTATNSAGSVQSSTEVSGVVAPTGSSADTTPPTTPTGVILTVISSSEIDLSWNPSTDSGGSGLGGYTINRTLGTTTVIAGSVGPSTTTFRDTGLQSNTLYSYTVSAFDNANNTATSTSSSATTKTSVTGGDQTVSITQPTQNQVFTQQQQTLKAIVVPGSFPVGKVTVTINSGIELQLSPDSQTTNGWTKSIALAAGQNTIVVRAYDNTGAIVSKQVQCSFSTTNTGPTVTFLNPATDGSIVTSNSLVVQVDVEDLDGIDPTSVQVSTDGITWTTMTPPS